MIGSVLKTLGETAAHITFQAPPPQRPLAFDEEQQNGRSSGKRPSILRKWFAFFWLG